jgi:hypothetical protein
MQDDVLDHGADASPEPEDELVEAEAETEESEEVEESEAESPTADEEDVDKKTGSAKERIEELVSLWRTTEREAHEFKSKAQTLEEENKALRQQAERQRSLEPLKTLEDFDYDQAAHNAYLAEEFDRRAEAAADRALSRVSTKAQEREREAEFKARESEFEKTVKDYREVLYSDSVRISPAMAEVIKTVDIGPQLGYFLGKNPDIAAKIATESPVIAGMRMKEIADELRAEAKKAATKGTTKAPPPPAKIKGAEPGLRVSTTDPASDKLSDEEWFKKEEARVAKLRR